MLTGRTSTPHILAIADSSGRVFPLSWLLASRPHIKTNLAINASGKKRYSPRQSRALMSSVPPGLSTLRLPFGHILYYPTGRPSIRVLAREIAALGYEVSVFPLSPHTDLRPLTPGVWHCAVVISDIILFIVAPAAPLL